MFTFTPKSKLLVSTKSGINLGKVASVKIDSLTGKISAFHVSSAHVIPRLLDGELVIDWKQVIDWQDNVIIVSDTAVPAEARNLAMAQTPTTNTGAHFKELE
jgi:sporulation protein YlmC with PRC-barrel domain